MGSRDLVCAVDVGTASTRAAILDRSGNVLGTEVHPISMQQPLANFAEYDSEEIWIAVCRAVRGAMDAASVAAGRVAGIGFDATCSLIARDADGGQVSISPNGDDRRDTFVWLDHRAMNEADECTGTGHWALDTINGRMSPEMQLPKAMWLKRNLPKSWARTASLFDLPDFLTWKATGSNARSHCTLTCKWTYQAEHEPHWQADFLEKLGMEDFLARAGLPDKATELGSSLGTLTNRAASELGLDEQCQVAPGMIDAYAGALGLLARYGKEPAELESQIALIAGTSSCLMAVTADAVTLQGGWGPYPSVVLPGFSVTEGGQSATGALLDYIIHLYRPGEVPTQKLHDEIAARINHLKQDEGYGYARELHILPDFHGNRTPFADPHALGVISGLSLDLSFDAMCKLYWRTAVAIALDLKSIIDVLEKSMPIKAIHLTGGHARSDLLPQLYADATGKTVEICGGAGAMLMGSAMGAAVAAGLYPDLIAAGTGMKYPARTVKADKSATRQLQKDSLILDEMRRQRSVLRDMIRAE